MEFTYFKRAFLWIVELTKTLAIFWLQNPKETPAILGFIIKKLLKSRKFLLRNVLVENQVIKFSNQLNETVKLYNHFGKRFDYSDPNTYKQLEEILHSKFQILYFLIRKMKPKKIVETGVAAGESTGYILQATKDNGFGKLHSIDLPFQWYIYGEGKLHLDSLPAGEMSGYLIPKSLKVNWKLILGNTYEKLPGLLRKLGKVDIFFHDSEHTDKTMTFEYKVSWPYIKRGGFLISDDADYTKAFISFSNKMKARTIKFKDLGIIKK